MKTEEENKLDKNELAERLKAIAAKAKSPQAGNVRFVVLLLALAAVVGVWWYLRGSNKKSEAEMWRTFETLNGAENFEKFADGHANTLAGRAARLQQARGLFAQGAQELTTRAFDAESRKKTIEKLEQARDLFVKLTDEFKDDLTLKAQCLEGAAAAELSLVGIPTSDTSTSILKTRGDVKKAAGYYRDYAKLVGETTKVGEAATKKAADLEAKEADISTLGSSLNSQYTPQKLSDELKKPDSVTPPANPLKPAEPVAPGKVETPAIPPPTTPAVPGPATPAVPGPATPEKK